MPKLTLIAAAAVIATALGLATLTSPATASRPCLRRDFQTELVKNACTSGGQYAAKDAMRKFSNQHKVKSCLNCHATLSPEYDLKEDALAQFKALGGK